MIYDFSENVQPSLSAGDLHTENLTTADAVSTTLSYGGNDVATFSVTGHPNGVLPKGNYQSTIFADAVHGADQQPMQADGDFEFFFLPADANHDRQVNLLDYNIFATNNGQSPRTFSQGDFNYDGQVNISDWNILASNYGTNLEPMPAPGTISVSDGAGQTELAWELGDIPADAEGIRIQRSLDGQIFDLYATLLGTEHKFFVDDGDSDPEPGGPGLPTGSRFSYRARAFGGESGGTPYTAKEHGFTVMPPPENVQATAISSTQVQLTWNDVTSNEVKYKIEITEVGGSTWIIDNVPANASSTGSYPVTGLTPNTSYTFRMQAWGPARESIWTLATTPVTTPTEQPALPAPTNLVAGTPTFMSVPLTWSYNGNGQTGFRIYRASRVGDAYSAYEYAGTVGAAARTFPVTGLEEGLKHSFYVVAANGVDQSVASNIAYSTTKLSPPSSLNVVSVIETGLDLSWSGGSNYRTGYILEVSEDGGPYNVISHFSSDEFTHSLTGLKGGSEYSFHLSAVRGSVASEPRFWAGATPFPAPSAFNASVVSSREVNLTWSDNAETEDEYIVEYAKIGGGTQTWETIHLSANSKGFALTGLEPEEDYTFSIVASRSYAQITSSSETLTRTLPADPPPHPPLPGPYKVWVGGITKGTTGFSYESGELHVADTGWIDASTPEGAVLKNGVVDGTVRIRKSQALVNSYPWSAGYSVYYDENPYGPPVTLQEPLRWDARICAYTGIIALEDHTDNDNDDWIWPIIVRPYGCETPLVTIRPSDRKASEDPVPGESQPKEAEFEVRALTTDLIGTLTVNFHPVSGSATHPSDYRLYQGNTELYLGSNGAFSLDFAPGETEKTITVRPIEDAASEGIEDVGLHLKAMPHYLLVAHGGSTTSPATAPKTNIADTEAKIAPDTGEEGNTGGLVPSVQKDKPAHYISPKLQGGAVKLVALLPEGANENEYTWVGATVDPNDRRKATVPRDNANLHVVQLKRGDKVKAEMKVWIVWATISTTSKPLDRINHNQTLPTYLKFHEINATIISVATVEPQTIFNLNTDVPNLRGTNVKPDLTGVNFEGHPQELKNGVNARWDMSRRIAIRSGLSDANGNNRPWVLDAFSGPVDFPADAIVGNDDAEVGDHEDNDPYDATAGRGEDKVTDGFGKLWQKDTPRSRGPNEGGQAVGYNGDSYISKDYFQDFVRLQLGPPDSAKWFVISDSSLWRMELHFRKFGVKESDWDLDGDNADGITGRVLHENDPGWPQQRDWNGDGGISGEIGFWDQDPQAGSFIRMDNAGFP